MKVCGGFAAILRTAEALRAAHLWAGPGWSGVCSLGAGVFAGLLISPCDGLQSFGATEPEMGQERKLKLEPLAAIWTQVVGRTWEVEKETDMSSVKKRLSQNY